MVNFLAEGTSTPLNVLKEILESVMTCVKTVFTTVTDLDGMGYYFLIGISISLLVTAVVIIKRICWGA